MNRYQSNNMAFHRPISRSSRGLGVPVHPRYAKGMWRIDGSPLTFIQILKFLMLHAPLMLFFQNFPIFSMVHSLLVLALGIYCVTVDVRPVRVAWVMAYIAGSEILWRGVGGTIFWEYGKYATLLLCILLLLKSGALKKATIWPLLFIAFLIPGIFVAPSFSRQAISYQLAGPITLAVAAMAFSTISFTKTDLQRLFLAVIAPTVSIAFLTIYLLLTQNIAFSSGGSNEAVTGGIGANQVASALSLGATAAFFYAFMSRKNQSVRNLMVVLGIFLIVVSVLTFSRAGLWNTLGALLVAVFFLMRDRLRRSRILTVLTQLVIVGYFVIFPFLMNITGGTLSERFNDLDSTGRDKIFEIDYDIFLANPVYGVGVGQSVYYHIPYFGYAKPTHTEYSRLMAEHGFFGIAAMILLGIVTMSHFLSRRPSFSKSVSAAMSVWALLYMMHAATRMVAPSFAFGLAAARFLLEEESNEKTTASIRNTQMINRISTLKKSRLEIKRKKTMGFFPRF